MPLTIISINIRNRIFIPSSAQGLIFMPFFIIDSYAFNQDHVLSGGGICAGISLSLLTHLIECQSSQDYRISANTAYHDSITYTKMLLASVYRRPLSKERNPAAKERSTRAITPGFSPLRKRIMAMQVNSENLVYPLVNFSDIDGGVLLGLSAGPTQVRSVPGCAYLSKKRCYETNHSGIAVLNPTGRVFVFDPNCGGLLAHWKPDTVLTSPEKLIDQLLLHLYRRYGIHKGLGTASVTRIENVPFSCLPFGEKTHT